MSSDFKILSYGKPRIYTEIVQEAVEWDVFSLQGTVPSAGERIIVPNTPLPDPHNPEKTVAATLIFLVEAIGSEGNLYGKGNAYFQRKRYVIGS